MTTFRLVVITALALCASPALAGITGTGGPTQLVVNPANQRYYPDPYNIDTLVFYWPERAAVTLTSDLVVSIQPPGSFPTDSTSHYDDNLHVVPNGTLVDSYLINYDPQGSSVGASFHFDDPIVGLITNSRDTFPADDHFVLSDFLISPAVPLGNLPGAHYDARGIEPSTGDMVRWLSPNDIEIRIGASTPGDQIRVITSPVPEPASLTLLAAAGLLLMRRRQ
jgi:hypothetical protein